MDYLSEDALSGHGAGENKASKDQEEESLLSQSLHISIGKMTFGKNGENQIVLFFKEYGLDISKKMIDQRRFQEEMQCLCEIYCHWDRPNKVILDDLAKIMKTLEQILFGNIQSFIPLANLQSYEQYTYVHAVNVSILSMAQADVLGYPKDLVYDIGISALLHEIGETQFSTQYYSLSRKLTEEEREEIKAHSAGGTILLLECPELPRIASIVSYEHHLKFSGSGYPKMRQCRKQHIASRIVAISDQFDAMRSERPYKKEMVESRKII